MIPYLQFLPKSFSDADRPWVVAALRQDAAVWGYLTSPASQPLWAALSAGNPNPREWSPADLALRAIGYPLSAESLRTLPLQPLESTLRQRAARAFEAHTLTRQPSPDLAAAGLIALALRERRRLTGNWDGLATELATQPAQAWKTPLASLYALVPDPQALLQAITLDASPQAYDLALHVIFSQPLPPDEQAAIIEALPAANDLCFLQQLAECRPSLAAALARQRPPHEARASHPPTPLLTLLAGQLHEATLHQLAHNPAAALASLSTAEQTLHHLSAELSAKAALVEPLDAIPAWERAVALAPENDDFRAGLALAHLSAGDLTSAAATLADYQPDRVQHPAVLLALAQVAHATSDLPRARQLASKALKARLEAGQSAPHLAGVPFHRQAEVAEENPFRPIQNHLDGELVRLLLSLGQHAEAVQAARLALSEQPSNPQTLATLAQAQSAAGDPKGAVESYLLAATIAPGDLELSQRLAEALEAAGEWVAALERRAAIAEISPQSDNLHALAACALRADQPQVCIEVSLRALAANPEDGLAHALLAEAFTAKNDLQTALSHFNQATLLAPHLPRPWLALARAFEQAGDTQKTLETLRTAAQVANQSAEIHFQLGEAYLQANAPTQALEAFQRAARLDPHDLQIALRLGQTYHRLGHLPQARQTYEALWQANAAPSAELAYSYAQTLLALGDLNAALIPLRTVVETAPQEASPYLDYACTLLTLGRNPHEAVSALRQALAIEPNLTTAHAFLAEALAACGDLSAALDAYKAALPPSGNSLAHDTLWRARLSLGLGKVALELKQYDTAIASLNEAAQADPKNISIYQLLTEAYLAAGLHQNALQTLHTVRQLGEDDAEVLIWYAEQMQHLARQKGQTATGALAAVSYHDDARKALTCAMAIAPQRADLWLRRAHAYLLTDDLQSAQADLRGLASLAGASAQELQQAARWLLRPIEDPPGAVLCLQKALERLDHSGLPAEEVEQATQVSKVELLRQLSRAYAEMDDSHAALQALEQALEIAPPSEIPSLRRDKVDRLLSLGQSHQALACIEHALQETPQDHELRRLAAHILRSEARLAEALASLQPTPEEPPSDDAARAEAIDLTRALLQFDRARQLAELSSAEASPLISLLHAELALDAGQEIEAAQALSNSMVDETPSTNADTATSVRVLALQARLTARRGDYEAALALFEEARSLAGDATKSTALHGDSLTPYGLPYGLITAAAELGLWDEALHLSRERVTRTPQEPFAHWLLARTLLQRAAYQRLCADAEVVTHAPGAGALSPEAAAEVETALQTAENLLASQLPHATSDLPALRAQAQALFGGHQETPPSDSFAIANAQFAIPRYVQARAACAQNDFQAAQAHIAIAIGLWADEPRWQALAAHIELSLGNAEAAVPHLEQAIKIEPRHAPHHLALGHALWALSEGDAALRKSALRAFERACRLSPDDLDAWLALAQTQTELGESEAAAVSAERAANLAPEMIEPLLLRAKIALQSQDYPTAVNYAQAALNIQPGETEALLLFTRALQTLDRPSEALAALEKSLPPSSAPVEIPLSLQIQRIELLRQSQGAQAALGPAQDLAQRLPHEPAALATLAHILAEIGEHEAAIRTAQQALQGSSTRGGDMETITLAKLHHLLGNLLRRAGQLDQAVQHLHQAVTLAPEWIEPYLDLGQAQQERRLYRQALQTYQQAMQVAPLDPRPYFQAGLALKDGKDYVEAENLLRRAANLAPKDVTIRRQLAAVVALNLVHSPKRHAATSYADHAAKQE